MKSSREKPHANLKNKSNIYLEERVQSNTGRRSQTGVYEREKYTIPTILQTCNCMDKLKMRNPNSYTENDTMKQSKADIQSSIKMNKT